MLNSVIIMGRMTADPELRTTNSGTSFCRFTVAVDRDFQKQGQDRQTDFINCASWRQQADFISKYFLKGQMIAIRGQLQQNSFVDQKGNKRTGYEVLVERANFCGDKKPQSDQRRQEASQPEPHERAVRPAPAEKRYDDDGFAYYDESCLPF